MDQAAVAAVADRFCAGPVGGVERQPGGHIHQTWVVTTRYGNFVLQRLNDQVFPNCAQVMENLVRVVVHLERRITKTRLPEPERRVLRPIRSGGGSVLVYDDHGPWRAFRHVDRVRSHDVVTCPEAAFQVGRGLGRFFDDVQDLPGARLREPIPGFKDFARRRHDFELVVEADPAERAKGCKREIDGVRRYHPLVDDLVGAKAAGRLRERVVHNDAKAANVLLDQTTGEAMCVVDLDTVGPGTVLYDVGDLLRSATVAFGTNGDSGAPVVRADLLEAALRGYLREAGLLLTADELALLPLAGPLMAYESALRFLTDHLVGDMYFRVRRPGDNLERARAQLWVLDGLLQASGRVAEVVRQAAK
ncbi:MAG: aminoglycoside phosphotransferase family protein [Actinobacteria bacterium]|nr:aminoglycoside phosphotransferase family protein [Actinomycetota bacterium]